MLLYLLIIVLLNNNCFIFLNKIEIIYLKVSLLNIVKTMSDSEESDYYSDNDSESEVSVNIKDKSEPSKIIIGSNNIKAFDEEEEEEEIPEEDIELSDDELQVGGDDDDVSDEDISINEDEEEAEEEEEEGVIKVSTNKKSSVKKNKESVKPKNVSNLIIDDDEDNDDDEYDDSYLQKFDSEITKNYVNEFHPECMIHNYDEISKLTTVVRDSDNIIIDPLHKTIPFLTKYERARVLGQRAKQIETGARPLVKVPETIVDSYIIAELELQQKRIPFIIRRPLPNGGCEYWNLKDLEVILF